MCSSNFLFLQDLSFLLQLNYVKEKELGFEKENMIFVSLRNNEIQEKAAVLKSKLQQILGVNSLSLANSIPGMSLSGSSYFPEGYTLDPWLVYNFEVDEDFIENTFRMKLIHGRNFSKAFGRDTGAVIINETLRKRLGWAKPLTKSFSYNDTFSDSSSLHVIGVVEDFHFRSLHESIEPIMIHLLQGDPTYLVIRLQAGSRDYTIKNIDNIWSELFPDLPFDYEYIGESFDGLYSYEKRLSLLLSYLTIFAMFIACLGLLGLVSFTAEQRSKEIGIRKVLGASAYSISKMLSIEYLKLIVLANILTWPLSYLLMQNWLSDFSYKTPIPIWVFLVALTVTLISALLIINIQSIKTSSGNPVNSLKYE